MTVLASVRRVKLSDSTANIDSAGDRQTKGQAERPAGRVHPRRLADTLLLDRCERVVVQLRDQQAEPGPRDDQRNRQIPAAVDPRHQGDDDRDTDCHEDEPGADDGRGSPRIPARLPASIADREHRKRQWGERQPGLHGVVLEGHLEEERECDHGPAQADLLQHLARYARGEVFTGTGTGLRSSSVGRPSRLRRTNHHARAAEHRDGAQHPMRRPTNSPPSCHTRTPSTTPPIPTTESTAPTTSTSRARIRDVFDEADLTQDNGDDDDLQSETDSPRQVGGDEAAKEGADRRGDGRRRTHERVRLALGHAAEVAVDERLHRRQEKGCAQPTDDRPKHDDRSQALGQRHVIARAPTA